METIVFEMFPKVVKSFDIPDGELAYLSLTSKPEAVIRDRYAFQLEKYYSDKYTAYIREYKYCDLAKLNIQDKENPIVEHVFEFKAGTATSFFRGKEKENKYYRVAGKFIERVCEDFEKRIKFIDRLTGVFIGVEATAKEESIIGSYIKYDHRFKSYHKNLEKFRDSLPLSERLKKRFMMEVGSEKPFKSVKHRAESAGSYRGIDVILHLLVIKPNEKYFKN